MAESVVSVTSLLSGCERQDLLRFGRHPGARLRTAESAVFLSPVCCQTVGGRICYVSAVILMPDCAQQILLYFCRQTAFIRICYVSAANLPS
ncbi:hypothetical protein EAI_06746 [Harpegnathos saltator]|uniref:Uncharacterized protein n=1 Tax=Harpegnathos saltator TaxID=610380 RepID=E2BNT5_HARSA|nr:hypothetical protein EAI_06746 [Harpegnathos saltator]